MAVTGSSAGRTRRRWKNLVGLLLLPGLLYLMLRWFEHRQVFHPYATMAAEGDALHRPWEEVRLAAADGTRIQAWFFPANPGSPREKSSTPTALGSSRPWNAS